MEYLEKEDGNTNTNAIFYIRYGPVGWNIYYDFNDSDFKISIR